MDANKRAYFAGPMGKSRPDAYNYYAATTRRPFQQGARQDAPSWSDSPATYYAYDAGSRACGAGTPAYDYHGHASVYCCDSHEHAQDANCSYAYDAPTTRFSGCSTPRPGAPVWRPTSRPTR